MRVLVVTLFAAAVVAAKPAARARAVRRRPAPARDRDRHTRRHHPARHLPRRSTSPSRSPTRSWICPRRPPAASTRSSSRSSCCRCGTSPSSSTARRTASSTRWTSWPPPTRSRLRVARTAADVRANAKAGVLSALYGLEGGHALLPGDHAAQLEHLRALAARGVRYMTLTWINGNDIGGSSGDASDIRGLTPFGAEMVKEMNKLGVVVDVSHVSDATFWDAIRATTKPVLATHSSARALTNIPRNMTDAMLKAVAANGGAVCVNFGSAFLDDAFHKAEDERSGPRSARGRRGRRGRRSAPTPRAIEPRCRWRACSITSSTSPRSPASITPAWAATSTACRRRPSGWRTSASCPRSPPACARAASRPPTSRRSWAATCCACWRPSEKGRTLQRGATGHLIISSDQSWILYLATSPSSTKGS